MCRNSVTILNFDDVSKEILKRLSFEPFISNPWFLYEKCLVFCALSNEHNLRWSNDFDFSLIFQEMVTWPPTPVIFRISKITLKHAPLDFIHTCESWSSYLKQFLSSKKIDHTSPLYNPLSPRTVNGNRAKHVSGNWRDKSIWNLKKMQKSAFWDILNSFILSTVCHIYIFWKYPIHSFFIRNLTRGVGV